jgi:hypothetical protein
MPDGKINGNGGCDDSNIEYDHGEQCEPKCQAVIEHPMTIKVDDPAFFLSSFQTYRAEVFAAQFHVAQGAQESAAMIARNHSPFLGMIKTACLVIEQCLSLVYWPQAEAVIKGGKHINLNRDMAGGTWDQL